MHLYASDYASVSRRSPLLCLLHLFSPQPPVLIHQRRNILVPEEVCSSIVVSHFTFRRHKRCLYLSCSFNFLIFQLSHMVVAKKCHLFCNVRIKILQKIIILLILYYLNLTIIYIIIIFFIEKNARIFITNYYSLLHLIVTYYN